MMTAYDKFWCIVVAFLGAFFMDATYANVLWFFIWAPISAMVLGYYTLKFFAWLEDQ